ncbi:MAG: 2-oxoacid:acceptor oxidoreductase subunit alpha, partial [Candidatus Thermoplasmatota archaeon]
NVFTVMIGGKAGQGIKKAGVAAANFFNNLGRRVFQINDYPSLIRGGHNFSVVSSSTSKIYSHYMKADIVVCVDKKSYDIHKNDLADKGILIYNSDEVKNSSVKGIGINISSKAKNFEKPDLIKGVSGIAVLAAAVGLKKDKLNDIIKKEYPKSVDDNLKFASDIFEVANEKINEKFDLKKSESKNSIFDGNELIGLGAASAGLDVYFAYPMTPASNLLHFLAKNQNNLNLVAVHAENEIAVANMAIGSTFTGARTMVGTSGGGFCLMQEAFSLAGMCEAPVLFVLGQRPGPSTGVPTYTEQADLFMALNPGQGEFPRIVASPGSFEEAFYLTSELMDLIWRLQTPGVLLSEKHLLESSMSVTINPDNTKWAEPVTQKSGEYIRYRDTDSGISPLLFPPSDALIKWNSYEHDEKGFTTEDPKIVTKMHDKRRKKLSSLLEYMKDLQTVNVFGDKGPLIFTFGSTTMSVLEALDYGGIDATVVQIVYLNPFPVWELKKYEDKPPGIVVEQNSTGQLESLLGEKAGITFKGSINKYDGRPFDPIKLSRKIREAL